MFKFFKKYFSKDKIIQDSSHFGNLKKYLHSPVLWKMDCESVARGVAVGCFVAFIPVIPFQTLMAIFLAIFLRANLLIAFAVSWLSNPLTILPLAYITYYVGDWVLGKAHENRVIESIHWNFSSLHSFWTSFATWFVQFGKVFFLGLPVAALCAAAIGYLLVKLIWNFFTIVKRYWK